MNKKKQYRFIIPVVFFLVIIIVLFLKVTNSQKSSVTTENHLINKPLPAFSLPELAKNDGAAYALIPDMLRTNQNMPEQPFIINVWGSWCMACANEHEMLMKLSTDEKVNFVGLNYSDDVDMAGQFLEERGNPFSLILFDELRTTGVDFGLRASPESFLIDSHGIVRQHHMGEITKENWAQKIQPCYQSMVKKDTEETILQNCQK